MESPHDLMFRNHLQVISDSISYHYGLLFEHISTARGHEHYIQRPGMAAAPMCRILAIA